MCSTQVFQSGSYNIHIDICSYVHTYTYTHIDIHTSKYTYIHRPTYPIMTHITELIILQFLSNEFQSFSLCIIRD